MNKTAHKTEGVNRSQTVRFRVLSFTGNAPRKGKRIPLKTNKYNEQRDEETGFGYFGARYIDHELMTMWLSVDPMADKYPSISPYAYCTWNPVKLVDPDGRELADYYDKNGRWLGSDGNVDHVAYVAKSVTRNSLGLVVTAEGKQKMSITNDELLDRATWVCGESGGSGELITNRTQNAGCASETSNATVADYYAAAINNMANYTKGGFYEAIKIRMSKKDKDGNIIYTSTGYFTGTGECGNKNSKDFAKARLKGNEALNADSRFTNSIAAVIHSLTEPDPSGGCRAWLGGVKYAKPYVYNSSKKKNGAVFQFSFQSLGGYHSFYRNK